MGYEWEGLVCCGNSRDRWSGSQRSWVWRSASASVSILRSCTGSIILCLQIPFVTPCAFVVRSFLFLVVFILGHLQGLRDTLLPLLSYLLRITNSVLKTYDCINLLTHHPFRVLY